MSTPLNDSDLKKYLSSKNVRNARDDFLSSHRSQVMSSGDPDAAATPAGEAADDGEGNGSSGDKTSAEDSEINEINAADNDLEMAPEPVPPGFSRLENPDPAVQQLYDEGLDTMVEPLLPKDENIDDDGDDGCCAKMRRYKGVWFLLLTLVVLLAITVGVVLGAKGDDDDDDDENDDGVPPGYQPSFTPSLKPSFAPSMIKNDTNSSTFSLMPTMITNDTDTKQPSSTSNNHTGKFNYLCGADASSVSCDAPCSSGSARECPLDQKCFSSSKSCPRISFPPSKSPTDAPTIYIPDAFYCGQDFDDAARKCIPCSTGSSSECPWFHQCIEHVFACVNDGTTPTQFPTLFPTTYPTASPTSLPTMTPTSSPTSFPTMYPTEFSTFPPTSSPITFPPTSLSTSPLFPNAYCGNTLVDAASCSISCTSGKSSDCPVSMSCFVNVASCDDRNGAISAVS